MRGGMHMGAVRGGVGRPEGPAGTGKPLLFSPAPSRTCKEACALRAPVSVPRVGPQVCTYCQRRSLQWHLWGE